MIKEVTIAISGELFTIKEDLYFLFRLELYYIHMFNVQKIKCNVILYVLHCHNLHSIIWHSCNIFRFFYDKKTIILFHYLFWCFRFLLRYRFSVDIMIFRHVSKSKCCLLSMIYDLIHGHTVYLWRMETHDVPQKVLQSFHVRSRSPQWYFQCDHIR